MFTIEKRSLAVLLASIYLLVCVVVVFVLPKTDNFPLHAKNKFSAKVTNESTKGIKNTLKRTDKLRSGNRNTLSPVQAFVFSRSADSFFKHQTLSQRLRGIDIAYPTLPSQFGCLLNCCRRI